MTNNVSTQPSLEMTRRQLLKRAGQASLTLTAAQALSPFILSGHGQNAEPATIKVGILHSLTGTMAISETSLKLVESMAIDEINAAGGVLGKKIEAIVEDAESKFTDVFPEKAKKLLLKDRVVAVFGCWTSVSRKNVLPVFQENNGLLFYPVAYEGMECSKNVVYTGATPNQQIMPAIDWLVSKAGGEKKRFYLHGSNYIYPRMTNLIITKHLKDSYKLEPITEEYTQLGHQDYAKVAQDIAKAKPDVIFSAIVGDSNINFYKELAAQGISPNKCPIVAVNITEDELKGLPTETSKGHLSALNYFQSIDSAKNKEFVANVKKFAKAHGGDSVGAFNEMEAAYTAVYLWKLLVEKARSTEVDKVRAAMKDSIEFDAPGGKVKLDPKTQHIHKFFRMGRIRGDRQFDIVYTSPNAIEADPYPAVAFPGWRCDWTKGGETRGMRIEMDWETRVRN